MRILASFAVIMVLSGVAVTASALSVLGVFAFVARFVRRRA